MNMMGKRVNFACRSVITPDPYLDIDEIGIPELFAKKLTVTETANAMNLARLRKLIKNGPDIHPGYNLLVFEVDYLVFENLISRKIFITLFLELFKFGLF